MPARILEAWAFGQIVLVEGRQMNGGVFEGLLVIGLALLLIVVGVIQMRRWDARTWQEPTDVPPPPPPSPPSPPANH